MFAVLVACTDPVVLDDSAPGDDSVVDSAPEEPDWAPFSALPDWESQESGVATGMDFADMDGDGDQDLVVAYGNDIQRGPIMVYENLGGELSESAAWTTSADHYYGHIAVGDIDGDGAPDVVASRFLGDEGWDEPGGVQAWRNTGEGLELQWEDSGFYSFSCALGDLDLDGDLDLAVAAGEPYRHDPELSRVYTNDGTGSFTATWTTESSRWSFDVGWFDADADGDLDLVFANEATPHTIYLSEGGVLEESPAWEAAGDGFEGNSLDWGDVNGDGAVDLVISDNDQRGGSGTINLYCGPDFGRCWTSQDEARYQSAVSLEDIDQDGMIDLAAGAWGIGSTYGDPVRLYRNSSGSLDTNPTWISEGVGVIEAFAWADLDRSHEVVEIVSGTGLVEVDGPVISVVGGVAGDGYISGEGAVEAEVLAPAPRDLAVSHWDKGIGNHVYRR